MEHYTLNRFYHEAKALLEKYHVQDKEDYELNVKIGIEERPQHTHPLLECCVFFCPRDYKSKEPSFNGFGNTPTHALDNLEETLMRETGTPIIDSVAVELENDKPIL
jgi:hypothetical protein